MYIITIKSGLKYKFDTKTEEDAMCQFVKEQKSHDLLHAQKNNYECRQLDYINMITEIYDDTNDKKNISKVLVSL